MKTLEIIARDNIITNPYSSLKVMQSLITGKKQIVQVAKETGYSEGYISKVIKPLKQTHGFIERDKIDDLYYVPLESLVVEYATRIGSFSAEDITHLIQNIDEKKEIIANSLISKPKSPAYKFNPPHFFAELLSHGFENDKAFKKKDTHLVRFIHMLKGFFWVDWYFRDTIEKWPAPEEIKKEIITATEDYWRTFAEIFSKWAEMDFNNSNSSSRVSND